MAGYSTREFGKTGRRPGRRGPPNKIFTTDAITAAIAHELRQPLTAIAVNAGAGLRWLDADRPRLDRARKAVMRVLGEADRAAEVIARMRALASRGTVTETRRLSIHAVVRRAMGSIDWVLRGGAARRSASGCWTEELPSPWSSSAPTFGRRPARAPTGRRGTLVLELPRDAIRVGGDAVRLGQVITNIVENAGKYSGTGDPISISLRRMGSFAEMRVRDRGIGIRSEDLPHIFTPYFRCRSPQGSAREGSGLGLALALALARRLTELHGGTIEARSAGPGEGTELTVRLAALPEPTTRGYPEKPAGGSNGIPDMPSTQST